MPLLAVINGNDGSKTGHRLIASVVDGIIHPSVQAKFTWTGKTNIKKEKKGRFDELSEIHALILTVCREADNSYAKTDFMNDLIYKVFKYAHIRW